MKSRPMLKVYKRYQVYFFLYLAVICELLIVIVERDDAEAALVTERDQIKMQRDLILKEFLKNFPVIDAISDNQMKVGESRTFHFGVKGLGEMDTVTIAPMVDVYRLNSGSRLKIDSIQAIPSTGDPTGRRQYHLAWKAMSPGQFLFSVRAGTNRYLYTDMSHGRVKVANLEFDRAHVDRVIESNPDLRETLIRRGLEPNADGLINRSRDLDPSEFIVDVIPVNNRGKPVIKVEDVTTAVGYPTVVPVILEETTPDKSTVRVSTGRALSPVDPSNPYGDPDPKKGLWAWSGRFDRAQKVSVTAQAKDRRTGNSDEIRFTVTVVEPYLIKKKRRFAFAGESFTLNVQVRGLEESDKYAWTATNGGTRITGKGPIVRISEPMAGPLTIRSTYKGKEYFCIDTTKGNLEPSEFRYMAAEPPVVIDGETFEDEGVYKLGQLFEFYVSRCGICTSSNRKKVPVGEISVLALYKGRRVNRPAQFIEYENEVKISFALDPRLNMPKRGDWIGLVLRASGREQTYRVRIIP